MLAGALVHVHPVPVPVVDSPVNKTLYIQNYLHQNTGHYVQGAGRARKRRASKHEQDMDMGA